MKGKRARTNKSKQKKHTGTKQAIKLMSESERATVAQQLATQMKRVESELLKARTQLQEAIKRKDVAKVAQLNKILGVLEKEQKALVGFLLCLLFVVCYLLLLLSRLHYCSTDSR